MKLGLNIHSTINGQPYSAQDKIYLTEFLRQLRPDALVVMDAFDWALAYKILLPDTNVIYRKFSTWEGNLWDLPYSADTWWHNMQDSRDPRLTLYVTNESHGAAASEDVPVMQKAVAWWVRVMELAARDGIRLCLPNFGTGNPDMKWFTDDKLWSVIEPLFKAFKKYPQHYFALHHYFWKDIQVGDGNVDRHRDIRTALSYRGYTDLQYVLTEVGSDDIFLNNKRGWKNTLTEKEYIQALTVAKRTAWNDDHVKGATIFSWGGSGDWPPFNIMHATDLHKALIDMNNETGGIPTPPPPYVPIPAGLDGLVELAIDNAAYPLQATPSTDTLANVGKLTIGERVKLYRSSRTVADSIIWHFCRRDTTPVGESNCGWCSYPMPRPPIEVIPPPQTNTTEIAVKYIAALWAERQACVARITEIDTEMSQLASIWLDAA